MIMNKLAGIFYFISGFLLAKREKIFPLKNVSVRSKALFKKLEKNALSESPFYQEYLGKPFEKYPVIDKSIYMDNFNDINSKGLDKDRALDIAINSERNRDFCPMYGDYTVGLSSGTSGNRGLFVLSDNERAEWAGYIIGKMLPIFFKRKKVAFILRANNNLYESSNGLLVEFRFFDLIDGVESNIPALEEYKPEILIAPSSVLSCLARKGPGISPKKIISVAEVLDDNDKSIIQGAFNVPVDEIYQCTEGFLGATCSKGNMHLNESTNIIEKQWIDKEGGRFYPVITDLKRTIQPIVRYKLDDILVEDFERCACGSTATRLKRIEGRADDVLKLNSSSGRSTDVYPDFIRNCIISGCKEILEYEVVQSKQHQIDVYLSPNTISTQECVTNSLNELWGRLGICVPEYSFKDFKPPENGKKMRRVRMEV